MACTLREHFGDPDSHSVVILWLIMNLEGQGSKARGV